MKASFFKKSAVIAASLMAIGFSTQAMANPQFTLSPAAVNPALLPGSFTADTLSGTSTELLTVGAGGTTGSGYLLFTAATLNGSPVYTGFYTTGSPFASTQYQLYLTFQLSDSGTGAVNSTNTVRSLNFQVFIDTQHDDVFTPATASGTASAAPTITNTANDTMLAFGTLQSGVDGFDSGGGAFLNSSQVFDICSGAGTAKVGSLTVAATNATAGTNGMGCSGSAGTSFFSMPVPFYSVAFDAFNNNGNPSNVQRTTAGNVIAINSAVGNVSFNVPEPSTVALFGIAAVGLGLSSRRRKQ